MAMCLRVGIGALSAMIIAILCGAGWRAAAGTAFPLAERPPGEMNCPRGAGFPSPPLMDPTRLLGGGQGAAFCFSPGTPDDVMRYYNQLTQPQPAGDVGIYFVTTSRWSGSTGSPRVLTWSFIPDGVIVDGETNELFSRMDSLFASAGGRAKWIAQFEACFDRWALLTGTSYTRITYNGNDWDDGTAFGTAGGATRGDIRIAMITQDGAFNVLAYNYYPSTGGDMVLDRAENWASSSGGYLFLRNVLMHEHGHGLGLRHSCPTNQTKLMEPFLNTGFDGPQHDDIRGGQRLYGDDFEDNNSAGAARYLGVLGPGVPLSLGDVPGAAVADGSLLSIDANGEADWFRFTVTGTRALTCVLNPVGLTYDASTQNDSDGSCNSGTIIDSLAIANLNVQILSSNGSTVLATGASTTAGEPEVLTDVTLPTAGDYYVRVYESGAPSSSQLYRLSLLATDLDCNNNGIHDPIDLANGTSTDCNANLVLDECEVTPQNDLDNDLVPDVCEYTHGDMDLDGDVDQTDFGLLQPCLLGSLVQQAAPECLRADLDGDHYVDGNDLTIFGNCLSGSMVPYEPDCGGG